MDYEKANEAKASFDDVYNSPTPHAYLSEMHRHRYRIGDHAAPFFRQALDYFRHVNGSSTTPRLLDLGCSYGIGSALVSHRCTFASLSEFMSQTDADSVASCIDQSRGWFTAQREELPVTCIGMDQATNAIHFAERCGLLEAGIAKNLEDGEKLNPEEQALIRRSHLFMSTGAIGYVGPKTIAPILQHLGQENRELVGPFAVNTMLRMFDPAPIRKCFEENGFRFERLPITPLPQRNFESEDEQKNTLVVLENRGIDTTGLEAEGTLYADLYVAAREADLEDFAEALAKTKPCDH